MISYTQQATVPPPPPKVEYHLILTLEEAEEMILDLCTVHNGCSQALTRLERHLRRLIGNRP